MTDTADPPPFKVFACRLDRTRVPVDPMWQRGAWAVTKAIDLEGGHADDVWGVTHLPSGGMLTGAEEPLRRAIGLAFEVWRRVPEFAADAEWGSPPTLPQWVIDETIAWLKARRLEDARSDQC